MVFFVDLDEEGEPPQTSHHYGRDADWNVDRAKEQQRQEQLALANGATAAPDGNDLGGQQQAADEHDRERENPNLNGMTEALGRYPIVMAIASSLDLNTLDNLSRTCRQVRESLLQHRSPLVTHTLHCANEDVPIDPGDTFRYRARAGNWFYMEDGRTGDYSGKSGSCARDMVAECRRCARVVCRNCAIKPPAPAVFRDRHRRLCIPCTKALLGTLAKPPLRPDTHVDAAVMRRAVCTCASEGVWLCQPCGRSMRGADQDYKSIWKWRNQYGEVLGGLGTGIGEGDRGVICGREEACCGAKGREQETDCDAADARNNTSTTTSSPWSSPPLSLAGSPPQAAHHSSSHSSLVAAERRTPSPQLRPGYARHEIEGIGGVVKTKLVRMMRVGACVPEWEDEKNKGEILGREVSGRSRSWCGWCWRVIPGMNDLEAKGKTSS
ncbi:Uu.00g106890.m01.CDS01 [Anthostomella pinea]|uniref:Uu.00g106890.m01.CDS01 n=1 Tax=Anthostomella pinea TaxID=933095 RepID=A0AAI8VEA7_9PEZI|nr:Uu.00g106890.m01.CDS01 [Anthostomella pinea]